MKRGIGTSGYDGYRIEMTILCQDYNPNDPQWKLLEEEIYQNMPMGTTWRSGIGANWRYRTVTGETGHKPTEIYHRLKKTVWDIVGYRQIYFEARPIEVKDGIYFSSEENDYKKSLDA